MLRNLLEGRPLKHPIHPMLVHLPIGLFVLGSVLDVISYFSDSGHLYADAAFWALLAGVLTALLAAFFGLVDFSDIRQDHPAHKTARTHMVLNFIAVGLYILSLALRWRWMGTPNITYSPAFAFLIGLVALGLLGVSGYLGGVLVYDDGIAVGRHRRAAAEPLATIRVQAGIDGWADVASLEELRDKSTLRAEINGTVVVLVENQGQVFALQEFCTHRYGPLSEGSCQNGQIVCPWHRSHFDLRSGAVTQGPAKVPLKTFEVHLRDGRICVRAAPTAQA